MPKATSHKPKSSPRRIIGEHFRTDGKPKRKFASKRAAIKFMQDHDLSVEIYGCTFCQQWHLASERPERSELEKDTPRG